MKLMPRKAPAIDGPTTRELFILSCCSTTAFAIFSRPTRSPMKAWRAGPTNEKHAPWMNPARMSCQNSSRSKAIIVATQAEFTAMIDCETQSTVRFGSRSAMTPPTSERSSWGTPKARVTAPSALLRPVSA